MNYDAMIGVGGIGAGSFFAISGDRTLGREESRGGRFLDRRDACKLHIISHYVQALLGPDFRTLPLGKVGSDQSGIKLLREMRDTGLDTSRMETVKGGQTLFSFCFVYPDGSGGNLTTENSVCSEVDAEFVIQAEPEFARYRGRGIALAVPEVPLSARRELFDMATRHGFWRVASFTSEEMASVVDASMLASVDLLALNAHEAEVFVGEPGVERAVEALSAVNPRLLISITAGKSGSWFWDGDKLDFLPAHNVEAATTAGAGDAHLAGMIVGAATGLGWGASHQLAALTAAMSVMSPHTINPDINPSSLLEFATVVGADLSSVESLKTGNTRAD